MLNLSLAQRHSIKSVVESALLQIGPLIITSVTALADRAQECLPGQMPVAGVTCGHNPMIYLAEYGALVALSRGFTGWMAAKHAEEVVQPGMAPGTPTTTSIESLAVTRPAIVTAPVAMKAPTNEPVAVTPAPASALAPAVKAPYAPLRFGGSA